MKYVIFLLFISLPVCVFPQAKGFDNIKFNSSPDGTVIVVYNFYEDTTQTYNIEAFLTSETMPGFKLKLRTVSGDIGKGKFAGMGRTFVWDARRDFAGNVSEEDFYIEMQATKVSTGIPWYYYAGGAVVGGVTYFLLAGKKDSGTSTPAKTELIDPPGRP